MDWIMQIISAVVGLFERLGLSNEEILDGLQAAGAIIAGLVMSWFVTGRIKRWRKWGGWKPRALAIGLAFAVCVSLWPAWSLAGFWLAVITGLGAPIIYDLFVAWAQHRWGWWPDKGGS